MRLVIKRGQEDLWEEKKNLLGKTTSREHKGVRYSLFLQLTLEREEKELAERHRLLGTSMYRFDTTSGALPSDGLMDAIDITVDKLSPGVHLKTSNIRYLLEIEKKILESAPSLKSFIEVMRNYDGENVVDI